MYKVSIWLRGGGKIVEETEISEQNIIDLYDKAVENYSISIQRSEDDMFPIYVFGSQIAAIQIDEINRSEKKYEGRRLGTKTMDPEELEPEELEEVFLRT